MEFENKIVLNYPWGYRFSVCQLTVWYIPIFHLNKECSTRNGCYGVVWQDKRGTIENACRWDTKLSRQPGSKFILECYNKHNA